MKSPLTLFVLIILMAACNQAPKSTVDANEELAMYETFKRNSETVLANVNGWAAENIDYDMYSSDEFWYRQTAFGAESDSASLDEMKVNDQELFNAYDFRLITDPPNLLPGVDPETKRMNGSVRHYVDWEVTRRATDSTPEKTGIIKIYESYDFDENGKIIFQQVYGDFGGLMQYLTEDEK